MSPASPHQSDRVPPGKSWLRPRLVESERWVLRVDPKGIEYDVVDHARELIDTFLAPALAPGRAPDTVAWRLDRGWTDAAELAELPASLSSQEHSEAEVSVRPHTRDARTADHAFQGRVWVR